MPSSQPAPQCPSWPETTRTEEKLLQEIWRLQRKTGWSFASQRHLAAQVGISDRQVRKLIVKLLAEGLLRLRSQGHGRVLHLRACPPPPERMLGQSQPRNWSSGDPGTPVPTQGGNRVPTNTNSLKKLSRNFHRRPTHRARPAAAAAAAAGQQPSLYEPNVLNPWFERTRLVNARRLTAEEPLARALEESYREGMWRFVWHEDLARTVVAARADEGWLEMHLAVEGSVDATDVVRVNAASVGGLRIWNQGA